MTTLAIRKADLQERIAEFDEKLRADPSSLAAMLARQSTVEAMTWLALEELVQALPVEYRARGEALITEQNTLMGMISHGRKEHAIYTRLAEIKIEIEAIPLQVKADREALELRQREARQRELDALAIQYQEARRVLATFEPRLRAARQAYVDISDQWSAAAAQVDELAARIGNLDKAAEPKPGSDHRRAIEAQFNAFTGHVIKAAEILSQTLDDCERAPDLPVWTKVRATFGGHVLHLERYLRLTFEQGLSSRRGAALAEELAAALACFPGANPFNLGSSLIATSGVSNEWRSALIAGGIVPDTLRRIDELAGQFAR